MQKLINILKLTIVLLCVFLLIACGGGGGGGGEGGDVIINDSDTQPKPSLSADAGPDQAGSIGVEVVLDGEQSKSDLIDSYNYTWSFSVKPPGSTAQLKDAETANPTFTTDVAGDYVIKLIISSGDYKSEDTVVIKAYQPVANAGPNQMVSTGKEVQLSASDSRYQGQETLYYFWVMESKPENSSATLFDGSVVNPSFIADVDGDYEISLFISNGIVNSNTDTVKISAATIPIANAGEDQAVSVGATVQLDANESSSENDSDLIYTWKLKKRPLNSVAELSDSSNVAPTFMTDKAGKYEFELVVKNDVQQSPVDTLVVTAELPIANAGEDVTVSTNATVQLDASNSNDLSNLPMTLIWEIIEKPAGSTAELDDEGAITPTLLADKEGEYRIHLVVNNGLVDSITDEIVITAKSPVAEAGDEQWVHTRDLVTLNGNKSVDSAGLPLTYQWQITSKPDGSIATLNDESAPKPSFTADIDGYYELQLVVNNGLVDSVADTVKIRSTTAPIAHASAPALASVNQSIQLDGSKSSDVNKAELLFTWTLKSKPNGSISSLSDPFAKTPEFIPDVVGDYVVELLVNNAIEDSQPSQVTITAGLPVAEARWNYNVTPGTNIIFNGDNSKDYDNTTAKLNYSWEVAEQPLMSNTAFVDASLQAPQIVFDELGPYQICLTVNNTFIDSEPSCVEVNVRTSVGANSGIYSDDFETGMAPSWSADNGVWEVGVPTTGPEIAYVGQNVMATILDGSYTASSRVESTSIQLPAVTSEKISLSFWHWFSIFTGSSATNPYGCSSGKDYCNVDIAEELSPGVWSDWVSLTTSAYSGSSGNWSYVTFDITNYASKNIKISFHFVNRNTTYGGCKGLGVGWYIDELLIDKN